MPDTPRFTVVHAGLTHYADAYVLQTAHHGAVLANRGSGSPEVGRIILTEHHPVITVSRRPGASAHVLHTPGALAARGIDLQETDRGGDVTYHGPGQLVCYPIVDLNRLGLRIHEYMRALETGVIRALARCGLPAHRDPGATGVWVTIPAGRGGANTPGAPAKVAALGVRVRRWVTLHGLAINIDPDLSHFDLIVPCGLTGRPVTSLKKETGDRCPPLGAVAGLLVEELTKVLLDPDRPGHPPALSG